MKRVLLLGGGPAHVQVLHALARAPLASAEVLLLVPSARAAQPGRVAAIAAGRVGAAQSSIALAPLAAAARVPLVESGVVALDARARVLRLADGRQAEYDLLSLDTAAPQDRGAIGGAREHGLFLRPLEHFVRLLDDLVDLAARRVIDVVVVGAGVAGFELALALEHRLAGRGEERARVALVTGGAEPLAAFGPGVAARARRALARRRITVFRERAVRIERGAVVLASGARLACDAPLVATGAVPPPWLAASGLALDAEGFVATGPTLQSLSNPEVFAVGELASRADAPHSPHSPHSPHWPHSRSRAGAALALNLRRCVGGGTLLPYRSPSRSIGFIACGEGRAIAVFGVFGGASAEGRWAAWWQERRERAFLARCAPAADGAPRPLARAEPAN